MLLAFVNTIILGCGPRGTHDHIFLFPESDNINKRLGCRWQGNVIINLKETGVEFDKNNLKQ
jgi:hypothetical protein